MNWSEPGLENFKLDSGRRGVFLSPYRLVKVFLAHVLTNGQPTDYVVNRNVNRTEAVSRTIFYTRLRVRVSLVSIHWFRLTAFTWRRPIPF